MSDDPEREQLRHDITQYKSALLVCAKDTCADSFARHPPCREMVTRGERIRSALGADTGLTNAEVLEVLKLTNIEHRIYIKHVNWTYGDRIYPDPLCASMKRAWEGSE